MNRREFLKCAVAGAAALPIASRGAERFNLAGSTFAPPPPPAPKPGEYHVFSKMFQQPVTKGVEELCDLMAAAGLDGVQWTVRPKGHVEPARVKEDLPKVVAAAAKRGLKSTLICTAITSGEDPLSQTILKVAADCGVKAFRTGYFFYDTKKETFRQTIDRIKRSFASLALVSGALGLKANYQNHSSWGPTIFGGVVWDVWECIKDLDPKHVGVEYDLMHAHYETGESWPHGFDLIAPWIGAIDLKDYWVEPNPKKPKTMKKRMCPAGEGITPWSELKRLIAADKVQAPYILHFEHDFDKTDLLATVRREKDVFQKVFG